MNLKIEATRLYRFESAHQPGLGSSLFGEKESNYHGHNFELCVCTESNTKPSTGLSVDLNDLDYEVGKLVSVIDHKFLTRDFFNTQYPITHELIANYFADNLIGNNSEVKSLSIETGVLPEFDNESGWAPHVVTTFGGLFMKHIVYSERLYQFSALHKLSNNSLSLEQNKKIYGKCTNLHGHDYTLFVTVCGVPNQDTGVVVPYKPMDDMVRSIISKLDGEVLSSHEILRDAVATSENILAKLWELLNKEVEQNISKDYRSGSRVKLHEITLQETSRNYFTYKGDDNE